MRIWIPGGWLKLFKWGFGLRLPDINVVIWLGHVR